jgi:hypothetical protein
MPEARLFLERRSYRRRRVMDAVRMLPFACAVLWLVVPAMWQKGAAAGAQTSMSQALWYIFAIWLLAITAAFALWRRLRLPEAGEEEPAVSDHPDRRDI